MEMVIYYRGYELVTKEEQERILKLWGTNRGYNFFETYYWNDGYQTGIPLVIDILSYIENTRQFNERDNVLRERIKNKPKLTPSRSTSWTYVEQKMLHELVWDAFYAYKDEIPDMEIKSWDLSNCMGELHKIYGLPYAHYTTKKIVEQEKKIGVIPDPEKIIEFEQYYDTLFYSDGGSCYKQYTIKPSSLSSYSCLFGYRLNDNRDIYKKFPFLGKLHYSTLWGEPSLQIYVYDYYDSDKVFQTILNYLVDSSK